MKKVRVGVFMGGRSVESEVSFNSGRTICDHIDTNRYEVIPIFQKKSGELYSLPWYFLHRGKTIDFTHRLDDQATRLHWDELGNHIDFAYLAIHGRYAEDGVLQGVLDVLGIPYLGTKVLGSALGMHKVLQKTILCSAGICVPLDYAISPHERTPEKEARLWKSLEDKGLFLPFIVKPVQEGSSIGITVVFQRKDLYAALKKAWYVEERKPHDALIEEYIVGRECTYIGIQRNDRWFPLPLAEIIIEPETHFYDYDQKYMPGRATKITPADFTTQERTTIEQVCLKVCEVLNFATIARIDGILTSQGEFVVIDPNTISGMGPTSFIFNQAVHAGMSHSAFITTLIEAELLLEGNYKDMNGSDSYYAEKRKKIRIGVLLGGDSNEREISFESGRNVCYKLSPQKYEVIPIFVDSAMRLYLLDQKLLIKNGTHEIVPDLTQAMRIDWHALPTKTDFIFIALHGGKGENGSVQGFLEMLDMPYNGSGVLASALCMNKQKTKDVLASQGIAVPRGVLVTFPWWQHHRALKDYKQYLAAHLQGTSFPLIAKPVDDGCSVLVKRCLDSELLCEYIDEYFTQKKSPLLVEEYVHGFELTVGVMGNQKITVLPASLTIPSGDGVLSLADKFLPGKAENQTPAPLDEYQQALLQHTVSHAYRILGCKGYARIDCFYQTKDISATNEDRVFILEVNTLPALTPATCLFAQAAEIAIKPMDFIDRIITLGFAQHSSTLQDGQGLPESIGQEEHPSS